MSPGVAAEVAAAGPQALGERVSTPLAGHACWVIFWSYFGHF